MNKPETLSSAERALSATLRREVDALRSSGAHEVPPLIIDLMAQAAIALEKNAAVATTKEGATPIQSLVDEVTGICNCAEAYSSRGRKDPLCCPCNCGEAIKAAIERAVSERITPSATTPLKLSLDTDRQVFFYEQDHYYLSNFSAFQLRWRGWLYDTSEAAYHWEKFAGSPHHQAQIQRAASAHDAFKYAERNAADRRPDWDAVKVDVMRDILRAKVEQHRYVRRKLLETGDRELVENSWRDPFWGWGPNRDGLNMLGKLWMEVRAELRESGAVGSSGKDHRG